MTRSLTEYAAYLFDIDGTLLHPGSTIPGAVEALTALKAHGKAVRAVTNNSRMAHHAVAERFRRAGLPLEDDEVFSALTATAQFIAHEHPGATVYPFGADGLIYELQQAGLAITDQERADYVVAGYFPEINLEAITTAMRALMHGARFIAVNVDRRYAGGEGAIPGAGAFVAALERASGRSPDVIVGKPSITIVQEAVASVGQPASECLFVGRQHRGRRGGGPHGGPAGPAGLDRRQHAGRPGSERRRRGARRGQRRGAGDRLRRLSGRYRRAVPS